MTQNQIAVQSLRTWIKKIAAVGLASPISVAMTELTLGSKYYFKAYVKIGVEVYYGAELTFDTLAE